MIREGAAYGLSPHRPRAARLLKHTRERAAGRRIPDVYRRARGRLCPRTIYKTPPKHCRAPAAPRAMSSQDINLYTEELRNRPYDEEQGGGGVRTKKIIVACLALATAALVGMVGYFVSERSKWSGEKLKVDKVQAELSAFYGQGIGSPKGYKKAGDGYCRQEKGKDLTYEACSRGCTFRQCTDKCDAKADCTGVEFGVSGGRCELQIKYKVSYVKANPSYDCYRRTGSTTTPTAAPTPAPSKCTKVGDGYCRDKATSQMLDGVRNKAPMTMEECEKACAGAVGCVGYGYVTMDGKGRCTWYQNYDLQRVEAVKADPGLKAVCMRCEAPAEPTPVTCKADPACEFNYENSAHEVFCFAGNTKCNK